MPPLPTTPDLSLPGPEALAALLQARQTVLPRRLTAPGPDAAQMRALFAAAA